MANTKLTTEELLIQEKVKNFIINSEELARLKERYKTIKDVDSNGTSRYGSQTGSSNLPSSKVENMVIQKMIIEEQIKNIEEELEELQHAITKLDGLKLKIINEMLSGTQVSCIARKLGVSRKKVDILKKRAFREMYNTICEYKNTKRKNF